MAAVCHPDGWAEWLAERRCLSLDVITATRRLLVEPHTPEVVDVIAA